MIELIETIFFVRLIVGIVFLSIATKQDIKAREVEDRLWKWLFLISAILLAIEINLLGGHERETILLELFLMSMLWLLTYVVFVGFNRMQKDSFGGADAKAFLCLAMLFPIPLLFTAMPFSYMILIWAELLSFAFYLPKAMKVKRSEWNNITFPLMPFILAGIIVSAVIYGLEQIMM